MTARFSRLLILLFLVLPFVFAKHHRGHHGHGHRGHHGHRAHHGHGGHHAIQGVHSRGVQPRREIRDLYYNFPNQFNIYVLALRSFQAEKQSNKLSYYQILGIHGVPYKAWDGVKRRGPGNGYCMHDSNVFPTWHRPYVALFEEGLHHHAMKVARHFPKGPQRHAMLEAARRLRSPYFDWAIKPAKGKATWPAFLSKPRISVRTANGPQTIHNPLHNYHYHGLESKWYSAPWNSMHVTKRWPKNSSPNAPSRNVFVDRTLKANRPGQMSSLFQFFTNCKSWLEMSNDEVRHSHPGCSTSLETLHNNFHVWSGGPQNSANGGAPGGHMTVIPYSGHDPAFMLHHTMVDRLTAMWQAVYPKKFVPPQRQSADTFVIKRGQVMSAHSPLKPFRRNKRGQFWTSALSRHTKTFGYTYPELMHGGHHSNKMRAKIKNLYGPHASRRAAGRRSHKVHRRDVEDPLWFQTNENSLYEIADPVLDEVDNALTPREPQLPNLPDIVSPLIASNSSAFQYFANIQTTRYKLGGSYMIYVFMSEPTNSDPASWAYDPSLVGSYGVWSKPGMEDSDIISTSSVPLTLSLANAVENNFLASLGEEYAIPYLKKNLMWKIVGPTGAIMDPADVPDFKLSVVGSTLAPATDEEEFPEWSDFFELPEITADKAGGLVGDIIGGVLGSVGI